MKTRRKKQPKLILFKALGVLLLSLILGLGIYYFIQNRPPVVIIIKKNNIVESKPNSLDAIMKEAKLILPSYAKTQPLEFCAPEAFSQRLEIVTKAGWRIIINPEKDLKNQLALVRETLAQLKAEEIEALAYIGVDSQGLIYYQ